MFTVKIENRILMAALSSVRIDDIRFYLNSVALSVTKDRVRVAGTNGHMGYVHRLSSYKASIEVDIDHEQEVLINATQLKKFIKSWKGFSTIKHTGGGVVQVEYTIPKGRIGYETTKFLVDTINARYPDIERAFKSGLNAVDEGIRVVAPISSEYLRTVCDAISKWGEFIVPVCMYQVDAISAIAIPTPRNDDTPTSDSMGVFIINPLRLKDTDARYIKGIFK